MNQNSRVQLGLLLTQCERMRLLCMFLVASVVYVPFKNCLTKVTKFFAQRISMHKICQFCKALIYLPTC